MRTPRDTPIAEAIPSASQITSKPAGADKDVAQFGTHCGFVSRPKTPMRLFREFVAPVL